MDQTDFQHSVTEDLARSILIGRCSEEIARAEATLATFPPMFCGERSTKRMLVFGELVRWRAKKLQAERGL